MGKALSDEQATKAIEILNEECGAKIDPDRDHGFRWYVTHSDRFMHEWRFQGALGFGGKFKMNSNYDHPYVDCYPENMNDERRAMIERANARLAELKLQSVAA